MPNEYDRMNIQRSSVLGRPGASLDKAMQSMTGHRSIVPHDDNRVGPFRKTKIGLIQEADCTEAEWLAAGEQLFQFEDYLQLFIGDWLVAGERQWGKTYEEMAFRFNREVVTLYNYRWVCGAVEFSLRRENLKFSHYKEVAALPPDKQQEWLTWASDNNISVAKLRRALLGKPTKQAVTPEKQAARYFSQVNKAAPNLAALNDKHRQQVAERAEWLAEYYAGIARQAREAKEKESE